MSEKNPSLDWDSTRRGFISAGLTGASVGISGCSGLLESKATQTRSQTSTRKKYNSGVQREAASYIEENYSAHTEYFDNFVTADDIPQPFKDQQLKFWMDLPESNSEHPTPEPRTDTFHGEEDQFIWDLKKIILEAQRLDHDDWTKTGNPHIFPDGTINKEGHHFRHVEEEGFDGDAFPPRYYNHKGTEFDVRESGIEPQEWERIGPEESESPWKGAKIGKKGPKTNYRGVEFISEDKAEKWSLPYHVEQEINAEDLVGSRVVATIYDWMAGKGDSSTEPDPKVWEFCQDVFNKAPVVNKNGEQGVHFYTVRGRELPYQRKTSPEEAIKAGEKTMTYRLRGPAEYSVFVNDIDLSEVEDFNEAGGIGIAIAPSPAGIVDYPGNNLKHAAGVTIEESYGHGFGVDNKYGESTLMSPGSDPLNFLDSEWRKILEKLKLTGKRRSAERGFLGFYSGLPPSYEDVNPGRIEV